MYGQLGTTIFNGLFSYIDFKKETETRYVEISLVDGKPDLQKTGLMLDAITINVRLHRSFCNPVVEYAKLEASRINGEILPFLDGYGTLIGNFVIQKAVQVVTQTDDQGGVQICEVELSLREYVSPDRIEARKRAAQDAATALGDRPEALSLVPSLSVSPQADLFSSVQGIDMATVQAVNAVTVAAPNSVDGAIGLTALQTLQKTIVQINEKIDKYETIISISNQFKDSITNAAAAAASLTNSILSGDIVSFEAGAQALAVAAGLINSTGLPMQKDLILRQ